MWLNLLGYPSHAGQVGVGQQAYGRGLGADDADLAPDEFVRLRYSIVHCAAGAQPLGFLVLNARVGWTSE
jgi:uncharacterized membrane protein YcgQ (UPF0703/DUF1980 family)